MVIYTQLKIRAAVSAPLFVNDCTCACDCNVTTPADLNEVVNEVVTAAVDFTEHVYVVNVQMRRVNVGDLRMMDYRGDYRYHTEPLYMTCRCTGLKRLLNTDGKSADEKTSLISQLFLHHYTSMR